MSEQEAAVIMYLLGIKTSVQWAVFETCGGLRQYLETNPANLPETVAAPLRLYRKTPAAFHQQAVDHVTGLQARQIALLAWDEPLYPALLREIHRPPLLLYVKGDAGALSLPQIAVVGSRNASLGGLQVAENFSAALAASGFAITSGMALGIDGAAHRGALKTGKTIAVLGAGVDVIYPRQHGDIYGRILAEGGAIISELPPGTRPLRPYFPMRNRIISGLSTGVLVVEAALKSGSLITARLAMEQGREVFAIPGSIHNPMARGCHQLIREGAVLTETLDDMVDHLGGMLALKADELEDARPLLPEHPGERAVLERIGFDPLDFDSIANAMDMSPGELTTLLVSLELQGLIENIAGRYQRIH